MLGHFTGQIDLDQCHGPLSGLRSAFVNAPEYVRAVDGVDAGKRRPSLAGFVRLHVTDQMPLDGRIGRCVHLL